ncbi:MarR family winged helix-turn-helix transcriptional regulator [Arthrobacter sp. GCM10027362]|uniref:MarR family winged helix-turn-helix transcriptional regulator n=1 Tax=Arthrobacter sp. GCM10027362 TaxID=3273379 RepID=UPI0036433763
MTDSSTRMGGREDPTPGVQVRHGFALLLQWASRSEFRRYVFGPAAADLSATDAALLEYLTLNGPMRLSDLAARWGVNKSTMTSQVHRLEARGLIDRRPDPADRRATLLGTSAAGIELQQRIGAAGAAAFDEILSTWAPEDREALGAMLVRFANELSAATPRLFQTPASAGPGGPPPPNDPEKTAPDA